MDIEQIKNYEQQLEEIRDKQQSVSRQYYIARTGWAKLHSKFQKDIAIELIECRKTYKSAGAERALLFLLGKKAMAGDSEYFEDYGRYELLKAEYKALDRALDALQNQQTAIQSIMKWSYQGETYTKAGGHNGV